MLHREPEPKITPSIYSVTSKVHISALGYITPDIL